MPKEDIGHADIPQMEGLPLMTRSFSLKRFLAVLTILMGSTMTVMAGATISPALPEMSAHFQDAPDSEFLVKLILTIPSLAVALTAPFMGVLLDKWGRKPVLVLALLLYGTAGSAGFVLDSIYAILVSRALLGLSVAGIMSGFTTLIADNYEGPMLSRVMGAQGAFTGFGGVVFLIAGGLLADVGWQYPFLVYLTAFAVLPGLLFFIREPRLERQRDEKASPETRRALRKWLILAYGTAFFVMVIFYMVPVQIPFYLQAIADVSNAQVGVAIAVMTLFSAITATQYSRLKGDRGFRRIFTIIFMIMAMGYAVIAFADGYYSVMAGLAVFGLGMGFLVPNMNVWLTSFVPANVRGRAFGLLATAFFLGQFFSPIFSQPLVGEVGISRSFLVAAAILFLAAFLFGSMRYVGKNRDSR